MRSLFIRILRQLASTAEHALELVEAVADEKRDGVHPLISSHWIAEYL